MDKKDPQLTETIKHTSPTNGAIFRGILSLGVTYTGIIVFCYAGRPLQNTVNSGRLWLTSLLFGFIFFIVIAILSKPRSLSLLNKLKSRRYTYILYLIGSIIWTFNMTSFMDTVFANPQVKSKDFVVISKSVSYDRYGINIRSYFLDCKNEGDEVVFDIDKLSWYKIKENDSIKLYLKKGYFGGEYVTLYQRPTNNN